jgi:hypothetical protein
MYALYFWGGDLSTWFGREFNGVVPAKGFVDPPTDLPYLIVYIHTYTHAAHTSSEWGEKYILDEGIAFFFSLDGGDVEYFENYRQPV